MSISLVYSAILICYKESTLSNIQILFIELLALCFGMLGNVNRSSSHDQTICSVAKFQHGLTTNSHVPYASGCMALLPIGDLTALANSRPISSSERVSWSIIACIFRPNFSYCQWFRYCSYDDPNVVPACAQSLLRLLLDTTFIITLNIGGSHVRYNINKVFL